MVPPRQQHDAIGVEAHVLQGVDRSDDFLAFQIDDLDLPVVHALQIEERVLYEAVQSLVNPTWWAPAAVLMVFSNSGLAGFLLISKIWKWPGLAVVTYMRRDFGPK